MPDEPVAFRADENALIRFGDPGTAPILNYNVPQPSEYNGRHYLELEFSRDVWSAAARVRPERSTRSGEEEEEGEGAASGSRRSARTIEEAQEEARRIAEELWGDRMLMLEAEESPQGSTLRGLRLLGRHGAGGGARRDVELDVDARLGIEGAEAPGETAGADPVPGQTRVERMLDQLIAAEGGANFVRKIQDGYLVVERRDLLDKPYLTLVTPPEEGPTPRLAIIHSCRMSSYLGDYGAGRTVGTFSLLPGEKHEIEIKTYKRRKETQTEASSILDSYEETTGQEFQEDLASENTAKDNSESNFSYHAEAEASASWGWGKAKISGGVAGGSSSQREQFAKNVASSTQKNTASAAAKRQMEVNTSRESETEEGEERATKRTIENINVGRTLNFVFRQMNQRFVTVLYITDVRLGFHNGDPASYREFTLPELRDFLEEFVKPSARDDVMAAIHEALFFTFDWRGDHRPMIEEVSLTDPRTGDPLTDPGGDPISYPRFPRQRTSLDRTEDGADVDVPGVVLGVTQSTLPTDGLIVEALLGQGNALDAYSMGLQVESVRQELANNDRTQAETDLMRLKMTAAENGDQQMADLLAQLFSLPPADDEE